MLSSLLTRNTGNAVYWFHDTGKHNTAHQQSLSGGNLSWCCARLCYVMAMLCIAVLYIISVFYVCAVVYFCVIQYIIELICFFFIATVVCICRCYF